MILCPFGFYRKNITTMSLSLLKNINMEAFAVKKYLFIHLFIYSTFFLKNNFKDFFLNYKRNIKF